MITDSIYHTLCGHDTREQQWNICLHDSKDRDVFVTEMTSSSGNSIIPERSLELITKRSIGHDCTIALTNQDVCCLSADNRIASLENVEWAESLVMPFEIKLRPPSLSAYAPYLNNGSNGQSFNNANFEYGQDGSGRNTQATFATADAPMHRFKNIASQYYRTLVGYLSAQRSGGVTHNGSAASSDEIRLEDHGDAPLDIVDITVNGTAFYNQGQDVDVIITDQQVSYDMEEWKDPDTGESRFVQYDWFNAELEAEILRTGDDQLPFLYRGSKRNSGEEQGGIIMNFPTDYRYRTNQTNTTYHGTHVASTVAGKFYGYASKANIYSINVLDSDETDLGFGYISTSYFGDFIRAFHKIKPVNPRTGRKNPTIVNASWGSSYANTLFNTYPAGITLADIDGYRHIDESTGNNRPTNGYYSSTNPPPDGDGTWSEENLAREFGIKFGFEGWDVGAGSLGVQRQVHELTREGIVFVNAAGNSDTYICNNFQVNNWVRTDNPAYDWASKLFNPTGSVLTVPVQVGPVSQQQPSLVQGNMSKSRVLFSGLGGINYHVAASPNVPGAITVGSVSNLKHERKTNFSNFGPAVDVYAPGEDVIGAYNSTGAADGKYGGAGLHQYYASIGGTSMAAPQVCGILACAASNRERFNPSEAINYLRTTGLSGAINANQGHFQSGTLARVDGTSLNNTYSTPLLSGCRFLDEHFLRDSENLVVRMMNPRAVLTRSFSAHPNFTNVNGVNTGYTDGKGGGIILNGGNYETLILGNARDTGIVNTVNNSLEEVFSRNGDTTSTTKGGQAANCRVGARLHQHDYVLDYSSGPKSWFLSEMKRMWKDERFQAQWYGRMGSNQKWPRPRLYMDAPTSMLSTLQPNHSEYSSEVAGGNSNARVVVRAIDPVE